MVIIICKPCTLKSRVYLTLLQDIQFVIIQCNGYYLAKKKLMDIGQHIMKDTEPCLVGFDSSLKTDKVKSQN